MRCNLRTSGQAAPFVTPPYDTSTCSTLTTVWDTYVHTHLWLPYASMACAAQTEDYIVHPDVDQWPYGIESRRIESRRAAHCCFQIEAGCLCVSDQPGC